ncbi:MAG TPA: putative metalloprotease CJM1_0395 family protein, partial [Modicisalibacter sp.]|nr:putative metalloprotease CJM1_0395 family protein [Modicisalibacter sp.]
VGGQYAGGASYTFERGPDGGRYAVAGEVPIDVGAIPGDPQATIEKMRQVRAAALAPAEPSAQDRAIAAQASQTMMAAQLELALQRRDSTVDKNTAEEDSAASPLTVAKQSADEKPSSATRAESIRAIQAYDSMAPGLYRNTTVSNALWAMA